MSHDTPDRHRKLIFLPRLLMVAGALLVAALSVALFMGYTMIEQTRMQAGARSVAQALSDSVRVAVPAVVRDLEEPSAELEQLVQQVCAHPFVAGVALYREDGSALSVGRAHDAATADAARPDAAPTNGASCDAAEAQLAELEEAGDRYLQHNVSVSIGPSSAPEDGRLSVWVNLEAFRDESARYMLRFGAASVVGFAVFFALVMLLLHKIVFRPLAVLTGAVRDNDIDSMGAIARSTRSAEFHSLIASVISMMLAERHRAETLEQTVRERTSSLEELLERFRQAQSVLVHQEKLASLGSLAAGIAHEINNPSGYVKSNLETLAEYTETIEEREKLIDELRDKVNEAADPAAADSPAADSPAELRSVIQRVSELDAAHDTAFIRKDIPELVDASIKGMERINNIVRSLGIFSRTERGAVEAVDLTTSIRDALEIVHNELKYDFVIDLDLQPEIIVPAVQGQLEQVFVNLLMNARDATPKGGTIAVSSHRNQEDDDAVVRISDTGVGIAAEDLSKIFDPFFTTKSVGSGTGLGLSVSYEIIRGLGGDITVSSTRGEGSTFEIRLPTESSVVESPNELKHEQQ